MAAVKKAKKDLKNAKAEFKANKSVTSKSNVEKKKKALERMEEQLTKLQVNLTDKVRSLLNTNVLFTQSLWCVHTDRVRFRYSFPIRENGYSTHRNINRNLNRNQYVSFCIF